MTPLTEQQLLLILPNARQAAGIFLPAINRAALRWKIDSRVRMDAFLAQVGHESGQLRSLVENLNYSAEALVRTWQSRFTPQAASSYARQPEKIANRVYGGRMGNDPESSGAGMSGWGVRVIALLLMVASCWGAYGHGRSVERAEAGQASAERGSGDRLAEVIGERAERQEEQRRAAAQEEMRANAHEQKATADAGAAGADAAGQQLRNEAGNLAASVSCAGPDPAAAARGEAARRAAMVLSDLLSRSVDTNRELAAAYDSARVAGLACERAYNALIRPSG